MSDAPISLCHWGPFRATVRGGRLVAAEPLEGSGADADMIGGWPALVHSERRIDRPHIRRGFLDHGIASNGAARGRDEMVAVPWDEALDMAAAQIARVQRDHGPTAIFGGSYGWSSAGRFHHARTQVRRFLAATGGFTDQAGNYSWGAAQALLPHVLGSADAVSGAATSWDSVAEHGEVVVAFGGLNAKNWRVTSGGAGDHHIPEAIAKASTNGVRFVVIAPHGRDCPPGIATDLIRARPGSDTAILLALCHKAWVSGRADRAFLQRYTSGAGELVSYLLGKDDGVAKTLAWAAGIADVPLVELETLWDRISTGRVMLSASWSLQRADHGEQPFWALVALAAMLGQIGLPGGGFSFGYGSMNGVGALARKGYVPAMPGLPNPNGMAVPAAQLLDCLSCPGESIAFNGRQVTYPDVKMIYWAGGNPFHHAQDLNALEAAWARPEVVIVNEPWWTPTAERADIVFPATTTAERNDIGGTSRDPHVFAMPQLVPPQGQARNDFDIFGALAARIGCREQFDDGLDEAGWLARLWSRSEARGAADGVEVPTLEALFAMGKWDVPAPKRSEVLLEAFRADPDRAPLATPSGRIELHSPQVAGFGYADCPGHPTWLEPDEWLGTAAANQLHLLTNQPPKQLHSQLWQTRTDNGPFSVTLAPKDAAARGIRTGEIVRLFNDRGACLARAELDDSLRQGVAILPTGAWFAPDDTGLERNGNPNVLTANRTTSSLGQGCAAQSTLVRVERWTGHVQERAAQTEDVI